MSVKILTNTIISMTVVLMLIAVSYLLSTSVVKAQAQDTNEEAGTTTNLQEAIEVLNAQDEANTQVDASQDDAEATPTTTAVKPVNYNYVAVECDSLTKLVRRAILTYDEANTNIELTKEGIIYAETNIVQDMGAYLLDIGDEVTVDGDKVATYSASSLGLTVAETNAWAYYVPFVDFDIATTQQPSNREEIVDSVKEQVEAENNPVVDDKDDVSAEDDGISAGWWFAGVGTAAAVWYLLWRREEE